MVTPRLWHNIPHKMGGIGITRKSSTLSGVGYFSRFVTYIIVTISVEKETPLRPVRVFHFYCQIVNPYVAFNLNKSRILMFFVENLNKEFTIRRIFLHSQ